ncbi:hypothetical protein L7F22_035570 [Adiantum nelumboides]|nr:hypothetical protein [Adiantum nelumboides]
MLTNPEWDNYNVGDNSETQPFEGADPIEHGGGVDTSHQPLEGSSQQNTHTQNSPLDPSLDKGAKRARYILKDLWSNSSTYALIKHFEEWWSHVNKGNFRNKDWDEVRYQFNREVSKSYTNEQVKIKIDTLKKKYRKEKAKTTKTGGVRLSWEYFQALDTLWSTTPHCVEIPRGVDSVLPSPSVIDVLETKKCENSRMKPRDDGDQATGKGVEDNKEAQMPSVKAQKVKEPKQASLGSLSKAFGDGMKGICDAMREVEATKSREMKELAKMQLEEETKRMKMYMRYQMEIAKLFAKPKVEQCFFEFLY